ncbi:uncharacterized protein VDAG_05169 [Verticillium dahliae VdLs.17]|uniref:C2H2-type domain-containing protein n=1 Tax=Verticillium dahliae (strain VdLs.17 / ATCC MYA-4575 / FGSC 10137) TaxID=498257 RepID=G2X4T7_VERDV|nr:uncharacterized protein VDAG_05169 [Verticillium dahliae VdLs.17]EGY23731.1 hypothetical protein VDAG_05169 [Verticillium dahliae VdLs.17]
MNPPKKAAGRGPAPKNYMTLQEGVEIPSSIVNDKPVNKNVEGITEKNYERQLQNWDDFVQAYGPRSVDSLEDLKEYVLRLGMAMRAGLRPDQKLAAKGIKSYWKKFTAGYNRERGTIPKDHLLSLTRLIEPRGALGKLLNLVADTGPRRHATAEVLTWAGEFSWTLDWKIFARPRLRIDHWAVLQAAAFTAARISDYIESSARYQSNDTTLIVLRNESGETEFGLQLTKWLKGKSHEPSTLPNPDIHERGNLEPQPLYTNPILEPAIHIQWHKDVLHLPVFSGSSGRIMTANLFSSELRSLLMRAGFPDPPGLHCFRAEGLTNIDANPTYSDIQRQTMAGHVTNTIQARYYSSRNPGIDSQAAFMRTQARLMNLGEHFRNLEISWEPELWHSLPIGKKEQLAMTEEYREIEAQIRGSSTSKPELLMDMLPTGQNVKAEVKAEVNTPPPTKSKDSPLAHPVRKLRRKLESLEKRELSLLWEETSKGTVVGNKRTPNLPLPQIKDHLHIYQCTKKHVKYAEFCFFCNPWLYEPEAWDQHCHEHLMKDHIPMELSWEKDSGAQNGYTRSARCPDPRCAETFLDGNSFQNHLHDLHHVPKKFFLPVETGLKRGMDDATQEEIPAKKTKLEEAPVETRFVFQYCNSTDTATAAN